MTNDQDIFKGFGPNWKWASISSSGVARVHMGEPYFPSGNFEPRPRKGTPNSDWDYAPTHNEPIPPEGIKPRIWERADFTNGPAYNTDKFGVPLVAYGTDVPSMPAGHVSGDFHAPTLGNDEPPVRTHLADGTPINNAHECFSAPAPMAPAMDWQPTPALPRSHLQHQLDANQWANFAAIDSDGAARLFAEQPHRHANDKWGALGEQMRAGGTFDTNDWETMLYPTSRPVPTSAADLAPGFVERANEDTARQMAEDDDKYEWTSELDEAKDRARMLTHEYLNDGTQQLTLVQYMAIFGEAP